MRIYREHLTDLTRTMLTAWFRVQKQILRANGDISTVSSATRLFNHVHIYHVDRDRKDAAIATV